MKLKEGAEIIGVISNIEKVDGFNKLILSIQYEVEVPSYDIKHKILNDLKGKKVGIIHIDGRYRIRRIIDRSKSEILGNPIKKIE